ncbi:hypothetical protein BLNAU_15324 [Blattamonas nauphoetae]|uniref:Uncharacterized protein n=1 Tax=Blattamonas nauphoetae TaxID=2049346 RepID=A0ABQ9XHT8_9EUKA|nr:hypothetical protein BLNAU_15324 [Blattamonas nauphoetae]
MQTDLKYDTLLFENLSMTGEISSMTVGRFLYRSVETQILGKPPILSVFNHDESKDTFVFVQHINTYKQVTFLKTSPQPHSLDCLLTLTSDGEWLLMQWNGVFFFPLATGSLQAALNPFQRTPLPRRFHVDPVSSSSFSYPNQTLGFSLNIITVSSDSPPYFDVPLPSTSTDAEDDSAETNTTSTISIIPRISFRAILIIEDNVIIGLGYDGLDSIWLSHFRETPKTSAQTMRDALNLSSDVSIFLKNGMEDAWCYRNPPPSPNSVTVATAETFSFVDRRDRLWDEKSSTLRFLDIINKIRDFTFTSSIRLPDFPSYPEGYTAVRPSHPPLLPIFTTDPPLSTVTPTAVNEVRAHIICDTGLTVLVIDMIFDFSDHASGFFEFGIGSIPISSSYLIPVPDADMFLQTIKHATPISIHSIGFENTRVIAEALLVSDELDFQYSDLPDNMKIAYHPPDNAFLRLHPTGEPGSLAQELRDRITTYDLNNHFLLLYNSRTFPSVYSHFRTPFAVFDAHGISFFQTMNCHFRYNFAFPLSGPPVCVKFLPPRCYYLDFPQTSPDPQPTSQRVRSSGEKGRLLVGGAENLICIIDGQFHKQFFPDKYIQGCLVVTGSKWVEKSQSPVGSPHNDNTPVFRIEDGKELYEKRGNTLVFFSTARSQPLLLSLNSGRFVDIPFGEDFTANPVSIHNVINTKSVQMGPRHTVEDTLVMGIGMGQAGALSINNISHSLVPMQRGQWFERLPLMFSSKLFAGATLYSLLMICEHCVSSANYEKLQTDEERALRLKLLEESFERVKESPNAFLNPPQWFSSQEFTHYSTFPLLSGIGNRKPFKYPEFRSTELALWPDNVDIVDGATIGIDSSHRTLSLTGAQGALVQVTTCEVRVAPTVKYHGVVNKIGENKSNLQFSIDPEPICPDPAAGLRWHPPPLHTSSQVDYFLDNLGCYACPCHLMKPRSVQKDGVKEPNPICPGWKGGVRFVELELASVTDTLIAASCGSTVFVLLWNPLKPALNSKRGRPPSGRRDSKIGASEPPIFSYRKPLLQHIATLSFPSHVTALSTATLCGRPFLLVGCLEDMKVRLFRADDFVSTDATPTKSSKSKRRPLPNFPYGHLEEPEEKHEFQVHLSEKRMGEFSTEFLDPHQRRRLRDSLFFEISPGTGLFVRNIHSTKCVMTQLFSLSVEFTPRSILFTTFNRTIQGKQINVSKVLPKDIEEQRLVRERTTLPYHSDSSLSDEIGEDVAKRDPPHLVETKTTNLLFGEFSNAPKTDIKLDPNQQTKQNTHPSRVFSDTDGVALFVGCDSGSLATTLIPLVNLLDFPPVIFNRTSDQQSTPDWISPLSASSPVSFPSQPLYTNSNFLPPASFSRIGRSTIKLVDDGDRVYVLAENAYKIRWEDALGDFQWSMLEHQGSLHALAPIRVKEDTFIHPDDRDSVHTKQSSQSTQPSSIKSPTDSLTEESESLSNQAAAHPFYVDDDMQRKHNPPSVPFTNSVPSQSAFEKDETFTLAWIGTVERVLYFGVVDRRRTINAKRVMTSGIPLSVVHLPALHAFAVLCRETDPFQTFTENRQSNNVVKEILENVKDADDLNTPKVRPRSVSPQVSSPLKFDLAAPDSPKTIRQISDLDPNWKGSESAWYLLRYSMGKFRFSLGGEPAQITHGTEDTYRPFRNDLMLYYAKVDAVRAEQLRNKRRKGPEQPKVDKNGKPLAYYKFFPKLSKPLTDALNPTSTPEEAEQFRKFVPQSVLSDPNLKGYLHYGIHSGWFARSTDANNVPFFDIANDVVRDKHERHLRSTRPFLQMPRFSRHPSHCYSQSTTFCASHPNWLNTKTVSKALRMHNLRLRPRVIQNTTIPTRKAMESRQRSLAKMQKHGYFSGFIQMEGEGEGTDVPTIDISTGPLPVPQIDTNVLLSRISPRFVVLLFDEMDTRTRIGRMDLSDIELLYGSASDAQRTLRSPNGKIGHNPLAFLYKTPDLVSAASVMTKTMKSLNIPTNSTRFYHWSCMTALSIPTFRTVKEITKMKKKIVEYDERRVEEMRQSKQEWGDGPTQFKKLGYGMNSDQFHEKHIRSLIAVAGRESTHQLTGLGLMEIHNGMDMFSKEACKVPSYESVYTDILIFELKRQSLFGEAKKIAASLAADEQNEQIERKLKQLPFTYPELTTAPTISTSSVTQLLNVDITLVKLIRVLGACQGLTSSPSLLYILNSQFLHIITLCDGDPELVGLEKMAKFERKFDEEKKRFQTPSSLSTSYPNTAHGTNSSFSDDGDDWFDDLVTESEKAENFSGKSAHPLNEHMQPSHTCSCTVPLFTTIGKEQHRTFFYPSHISTYDVSDVSPVTQALYPLSDNIMLKEAMQAPIGTPKPETGKVRVMGSKLRLVLQAMACLEAPAPITSISITPVEQIGSTLAPNMVSPSHSSHPSSVCSEPCGKCLHDALVPSYLQTGNPLHIVLSFGYNGLALAKFSPPLGFPLSSLMQTKGSGMCIYHRSSINAWEKRYRDVVESGEGKKEREEGKKGREEERSGKEGEKREKHNIDKEPSTNETQPETQHTNPLSCFSSVRVTSTPCHPPFHTQNKPISAKLNISVDSHLVSLILHQRRSSMSIPKTCFCAKQLQL